MNIEIDIVVILLSIIFLIFFIKILCMCYNNDEKNNQKARIRSRTLSDEQTIVVNDLHINNYKLEENKEEIKEEIKEDSKETKIDNWVYREYFYNQGILEPDAFV